MNKLRTLPRFLVVALCLTSLAFASAQDKAQARKESVTGGPNGMYPYLFKTVSKKNVLDLPTHQPWNILRQAQTGTDTLRVIVMRVEFDLDESENTTGSGKFWGTGNNEAPTKGDREELRYYSQDSTYLYDRLPHDSGYVAAQMTFAQNYFMTVSKGKFFVDFEIYPKNLEGAYQVDRKMSEYSPGGKKPKESWDEYYYRRTVGLMEFIYDAIKSPPEGAENPFGGLQEVNGKLVDTLGRATAILLVHAGSSYWTDGGREGYFGQDSPSDMIDAFVTPEYFEYFKDTLQELKEIDTLRDPQTNKLKYGVLVEGAGGGVLINEILMVSETSNQDSLNWGIHGILVNQIARQIGIPDLHSNQSEVGAFCIMDIAGYSAGQGFIPPYPSAWVRAFMGWDVPVTANLDDTVNTFRIKAVSAAQPGDTSILLVPINDHEYYLIENRQRDLTDRDPFKFDTVGADDGGCMPAGTPYISPYEHVKLDATNIIMDSLLAGKSRVINRVENYDVSIPASGVLIWHIDEDLVRDRLEHNILNSDSMYKAVALVEADGVNDLGILFQDVFAQAAFDYGGAEDVFPHTTVNKPHIHADYDDCGSGSNTITGFGPFTAPSTMSNDGGHSYLSISVDTAGKRTEPSNIRGYMVKNYVDSVFTITIRKSRQVTEIPGWPRRVRPSKFFDPVQCNLYGSSDTLEVAVLDTAGRLYVWQAEGPRTKSMGSEIDSISTFTLLGDSTQSVDLVTYLTKIPNPVAMPTTINGDLYVPSANNSILVIQSITDPDNSDSVVQATLQLPAAPTSYVCNYIGNRWAVGCADGRIVLGNGATITDTLPADAQGVGSAITAIALLDTVDTSICAIHANGLLIATQPSSGDIAKSKKVLGGTAPYTLATADLNQTDTSFFVNIVVCDNNQAVWLFKNGPQLELAPHWNNEPNDWANSYAYVEHNNRNRTDRTVLPGNSSAPALADVDGDGALDIILGGTNGVFALNYNGVLLQDWPAYLDNRYWYQRGSVLSSPSVAYNAGQTEPLIVFSAPTGENVTFTIAKIYDANPSSGEIFYTYGDSLRDSISGLSQSLIDTLLVLGDSLILPYITPGGHIDAMNTKGKRPDTLLALANVGGVRQSSWPITVGGAIHTSPLLTDLDNDGLTDLVAVSNTGTVYRFEFAPSVLPSTFIWPQAGYNGSRVFAYLGPPVSTASHSGEIIELFYNRPNPVAYSPLYTESQKTAFRYKFTAPVKNIRLDIFTLTGYHVYSNESLDGGYPAANEHVVSIKNERLGPGIYRCRLQVTAAHNGKKYSKLWKMAIAR